MLAYYFLRAALIFAAVLSMVQPAAAGWSGTVLRTDAQTCINAPVLADSWDALVVASCVACGLQTGGNVDGPYCVGNVATLSGSSYNNSWIRKYWQFTGSLSCTAPLVSDGLTCVEPPPPPPPPSNCVAYPVASFIEFIGGLGNQPSQACVQNCLFNTGSGISWGVSVNRQWQASGRSTGEFCVDNTAAAQSIDDPACSAGESLNASGVCAPLAPCPYDASIYAINVNCHAPLCATDVSLYASDSRCFPDPNEPASAVSAVVDCAVTPDAAACVGAVSGVAPIVTGTPGTSGSYVAPTYGSEGSVSGVGGSLTFDNVPDSVPIGTKTVDVGVITPVLVGSSGGCPAPSPMVLHGQTYYFDWTTYCNFAAWIKPLLLAFAWLAAAGILVGGFVA